jgi:hypothetical protein
MTSRWERGSCRLRQYDVSLEPLFRYCEIGLVWQVALAEIEKERIACLDGLSNLL